jgi:hypothetical protein
MCFSFFGGVVDSDEGDDAENGADAGEGESGEKSPVKAGKGKKAKGEVSSLLTVDHPANTSSPMPSCQSRQGRQDQQGRGEEAQGC